MGVLWASYGWWCAESKEKIWLKSDSSQIETKKKVLQTCWRHVSSALYFMDVRPGWGRGQSNKMALERKCYRKLLRIGWTQKVTNTDLYSRIKLKENIMQKLIGRKLRLFGHICRMYNSRRIKELMFGRIEGVNRRRRPHRKWLDDITEWGKASLQELSQAVMNRKSWKSFVKMASDNYGRWAHSAWWWWGWWPAFFYLT